MGKDITLPKTSFIMLLAATAMFASAATIMVIGVSLFGWQFLVPFWFNHFPSIPLPHIR